MSDEIKTDVTAAPSTADPGASAPPGASTGEMAPEKEVQEEQHVPFARFKEVNDERKTLRDQVAELRGQQAALLQFYQSANQAAPAKVEAQAMWDSDPEGWSNLMLENPAKATALMMEHANKMARAERDAEKQANKQRLMVVSEFAKAFPKFTKMARVGTDLHNFMIENNMDVTSPEGWQAGFVAYVSRPEYEDKIAREAVEKHTKNQQSKQSARVLGGGGGSASGDIHKAAVPANESPQQRLDRMRAAMVEVRRRATAGP